MFSAPANRRVMRVMLLPGILAFGGALACERNDDERDTDAPRQVTTEGVNKSPSTVPWAIVALGHHSENAFDMVKTGDWKGAQAAVDTLETAVDSLPSSADSDVIADVRATLDSLSSAVGAKDRATGIVTANSLTNHGANLSMPYSPQIPAPVTLLDYYGRELEIWAARGDISRLERVRSAMREVWGDMEPQVEQRGGAAAAVDFGRLMERLEAARSPADFASLATPILDEVDKLEAVFTR